AMRVSAAANPRIMGTRARPQPVWGTLGRMPVAAPQSSVTFDGRVPFPSFASIETTMKCNLQCPMCLPHAAGTTVNGSHMESEAFEKAARALFPYLERFQLTVSGEPLMSKGL